MFFQKYKKIILTIVILILAFFLYSSFFGKESSDGELLTSSNQQPTANQVVGTEIVSALNQIESLKLSRDIFEDPVFQSLIDRSEPLPEEPVGKLNPFSPIGSAVIRQNTSATSSNTLPRTNTIINTTNKPASQPVI